MLKITFGNNGIVLPPVLPPQSPVSQRLKKSKECEKCGTEAACHVSINSHKILNIKRIFPTAKTGP